MKIDREEFLQELKLRRFVRKAIAMVAKKRSLAQNEILEEEEKFKSIVRKVLKEASDVDADTDPAPYRSTAINLLADVLNVLLPIIKPNYRQLTSEKNYKEQRTSFRDNVLSAVDTFFDTLKSMSAAGAGSPAGGIEEALTRLDEADISVDLDLDPADEENLITPDNEKPKKKSKEDEETEDYEGFAIKGSEGTGARMAFNALNTSNFFDEIQKAYKILDNVDDKKEYESYLVHNLDLWFVKYEKELAEQLGQEPAYTEPTTKMPDGGEMSGETEVDSAPGMP
tara:strand:+ start:156 stop:1004 length:849 start_codon:yes stop_codon:yes gene_type:complete